MKAGDTVQVVGFVGVVDDAVKEYVCREGVLVAPLALEDGAWTVRFPNAEDERWFYASELVVVKEATA